VIGNEITKRGTDDKLAGIQKIRFDTQPAKGCPTTGGTSLLLLLASTEDPLPCLRISYCFLPAARF